MPIETPEELAEAIAEFNKKISCPECLYLIEYSNSIKGIEKCGVCGRSSEELHSLEDEYFEISKKEKMSRERGSTIRELAKKHNIDINRVKDSPDFDVETGKGFEADRGSIMDMSIYDFKIYNGKIYCADCIPKDVSSSQAIVIPAFDPMCSVCGRDIKTVLLHIRRKNEYC